MHNSPRLPAISLVIAVLIGLYAAFDAGRNDGPLTELQLGEIALAVSLAIFGIQGIISVLVEGRELHPGRVAPRLTDRLSAGIVIIACILLVIAGMLAYGIASEWGVKAIGTLAGTGCVAISLLLVFFKEAFIGDEANFDNRDDGVPW